MKHFMYTCALALTTLLVFAGGKASGQGPFKVKSLRFFDSCGVQLLLLERSDTAGAYAEINYGDGAKDTAYVHRLVDWFTHSYPAAGAYTLKAVLMNSSYDRLDSTTITAEVSGCNYLWGNIYKDNNSNCTFDAGESRVHSPLSIAVDSAGVTIDTISAYGTFYYKASTSGVTYSFRIINAPASIDVSCPSTGVISSISYFGMSSFAGDFGLTCASPAPSGFDVSVIPFVWSSRGAARVGGILSSNSCVAKSGTIKLSMDPKYTITTTSPAGGVVTGNTVTWSYTGLSMDASKYYYVEGSASPLLTIGDTARYMVSAPYLTGEGDTTNNTYYVEDTVRLAWDPNDKRVLPEGNIKAGQTLTYTLNFENTGNAPAQNIHVLDTLSNFLESQSVQVIAATHKMNLYRDIDPGSGRTILKFDFPNIMLKDSSHHGESTGSVTFTVRVRNGLPDGTVVNNRGGIYFDDNEVVLTNITSSLIASLSIHDPEGASQVAAYPNPVYDILQLKLESVPAHTKMTIMNTLGQVTLQQDISSNDTRIDVRSLLPGIYFVLVQHAAGTRVIKIEKR